MTGDRKNPLHPQPAPYRRDRVREGHVALAGPVHHPHAAKPGVDKTGLKAKLRELKAARDKALQAHDHVQLKSVRRQMHSLNRKLRAVTA